MTTESQATQQGTETQQQQSQEGQQQQAVKQETAAPAVVPANTGDAALDIALGFFAANGLDAKNPEVAKARETGDFSVVAALLKAAGVKGAEPYLDLAKQAAERAKGAEKAEQQAILDIVGGDEEWARVRAVVSEGATEAETKQINAALRQGGLVAKITAQWMKTYADSKAGEKAPSPKSRVDDAPRGGGAPAAQQESHRQVITRLVQKYGAVNYQRSQEYQDYLAGRR